MWIMTSYILVYLIAVHYIGVRNDELNYSFTVGEITYLIL